MKCTPCQFDIYFSNIFYANVTEIMCRKCASYCECKIGKGYEIQNMDPGLNLCCRARMANWQLLSQIAVQKVILPGF